MMGGVSVELWCIRIRCFVMPRKCKTHLKTLKPVTMSLVIRLVLFYLLVVEGVESNPGPPSRRSNTGGARGNRSPRGRGGQGGRGGSVNTGGSRWGDTNDIFAAPSVETSTSQVNSGEPPYSLRRNSRPQSQPSLSTWLTSSQPQSQAQSHVQLSDPGQPDSTPSDMDLVSVTSEQQLETDDNFDENNTTSLLLEIRRDVKKMNKKFDSFGKICTYS